MLNYLSKTFFYFNQEQNITSFQHQIMLRVGEMIVIIETFTI